MKTLYLLRHAEADNTLIDLERNLTARGRRQAESLGRWMSDNGIMPARIFSSAAKRTQMTAKICAEQVSYRGRIRVEEALHETCWHTYVTVMRGLKNKDDSVMIVGHNPEISDAITIFTGDQLNMYPCTLACIEFAIESWDTTRDANGILKWVQFPAH